MKRWYATLMSRTLAGTWAPCRVEMKAATQEEAWQALWRLVDHTPMRMPASVDRCDETTEAA